MGGILAPDIYVQGMGTVGSWDPFNQVIRIHPSCKSSSDLRNLPEEISCTREDLKERLTNAILLAMGFNIKGNAKASNSEA